MKGPRVSHRFPWEVNRFDLFNSSMLLFKKLVIRIPFFVMALGCLLLGLGSCGNTAKKESPLVIETFTPDHLTYPNEAIRIADSLQNEFAQNFFLPWTRHASDVLKTLDGFPGKEVSYLEKYLNDDEWYGENKKPHKRSSREEIVDNIDETEFPNFLKKGITIAHTNLRRIPSHRPGFDVYSKAGEGYPFDYFQETNLWVNTPLQLIHLSKDNQWCYVLSPYYKGWVAMRDLAVVSDDFMEQWMTGSYAMPLSDNVNLQNVHSIYAVNAKMGTVLPYLEIPDKPDYIKVYYANADENKYARILSSELSKDKVALDDFVFNKTHLQPLVSNLVGKPYGWGGNLENRDCSSMIRDLLATYKVWLPRDSKDQIEIGEHHELSGSAEEKIQLIKEKGIPFLTILRKKGHNMLYVGNAENGEPLIFHAIWGLKTTYSDKELTNFLTKYPIEGIHLEEDGKVKGRHIIGESVITTITAGAGNNGVTIPLIDEIYAMTTILQ